MRTPHLESTGSRPTGRTAILVAVTIALGGGCAEKVKPDIKPCPCSDGYVCCESGVCARDQASCSVATRALSEAVQGVWTGYLENFSLSKDDAVRIDISVGPDGTLGGTVVFGKDPPPPPPDSPAGQWPPGIDPQAWAAPTYVPGFSYMIRDLVWQERRLKFGIPRFEPWKIWCALQTSYPDDTHGGFTCDRFTREHTAIDEQGRCFGLPGFRCGYGIFCEPFHHTCTSREDVREHGRAASYCCECASGTQGPNCPADPACADAPLEPGQCPRLLCMPIGYQNNGQGVCRCEAGGCAAPLDGAGSRFTFDVALQDEAGNGSVFMSGRESTPDLSFNVRLTRTGR